MIKMRMAATFACAALAACGGKTKKPEGPGSGSGSAMGSGMDMGSGSSMAGMNMGSGSASAAETKPAPPPPPPPKTADELVARYQECWGLFNDAKWDDFKKCYTADAVSEDPGSLKPVDNGADAILADIQGQKAAFPDLKGQLQLILQNGDKVVGVALLTGTNTGPMHSPSGDMPPTKKSIGLLLGHVIQFNPQGEATHEWGFLDEGTMLSQLGVLKMPARKAMTKGWAASPEIVIAKNDDAEKANVAAFQAAVDAFNKHDAKAFGATLAKDVMWSDQGAPKDFDMKGAIKDTQDFWKGFSDVKITPDAMWGAGPYVVMTGTIGGTNDGAIPAMKLKKTGKTFTSPFLHVVKIDGGKISKSWIFFDGISMASQLGMLPAPGKK